MKGDLEQQVHPAGGSILHSTRLPSAPQQRRLASANRQCIRKY